MLLRIKWKYDVYHCLSQTGKKRKAGNKSQKSDFNHITWWVDFEIVTPKQKIFGSEMKWIIVPILMILLLVQSFSKWLVVMDFTIHRDFISKNLCENRNRPRLQCNGRCQLAKKLAEEEKTKLSKSGVRKDQSYRPIIRWTDQLSWSYLRQ